MIEVSYWTRMGSLVCVANGETEEEADAMASIQIQWWIDEPGQLPSEGERRKTDLIRRVV